MQNGEKSASASIADEKKKGKIQEITIRCVLFFDGTLNNKKNIEARIDFENKKATEGTAEYLKNRQNQNKENEKNKLGVDMLEDSYENDFSNVVRLQQGIQEKQPGYDETVIIYMEGAGTVGEDPVKAKKEEEKKKENAKKIEKSAKSGTVEKLEVIEAVPKFGKDEQSGFAFAAGETGIKTKVARGIFKAIDKIVYGPKMKARDPTQFIVKKLVIDVFGFSRGAASARYCVHEMLKDVMVPDGTVMMEDFDAGPYESLTFRAENNTKKMLKDQWMAAKEVEVCFVGLFDTVSSYSSQQMVKLLPLENWFVKLKAISKAKKVVQLASADEHRYHFSLHNIKSAGGKGEQYFLPGTHSDIGGGYLPEGSDAGLIVYQGEYFGGKADKKEYLIEHGWYQEDQLETTASTTAPGGGTTIPGLIAMALGNYLNIMGSRAKPRIIQNAYCQIPLKIMAKKADESGIKFIPKLNRNATGKIKKYPELEKMEYDYQIYMSQVGPLGSKPEHWHREKDEEYAEGEMSALIKKIRNKHCHFSARYNTFFGHNPRRSPLTGKRKRYEFDG